MNVESVFSFGSEEQKKEFLEKIDENNCGEKLSLIRGALNISKRDLAKVLGCSESTISRIEAGKTKPTKEFMTRLLSLVFIGHAKYNSLSDKEKKLLSEYILVSGRASGFAGAIGAISTHTVTGLSAAGVTSGLAAIGAAVGGGMAAGLTITMAAPVVLGLTGFGIFKAIKAICSANDLICEEVDDRFEISQKK